jgi:MurNAc alpha-1-phosphate uridylyltransferase
MRGFILAAGFGTRLMPLTAKTPKALIGVCGRPLLDRCLDYLSGQGIALVGVNAHSHAGQLADFQKTSAHPFVLFHEKDEVRGTGGGLYFARRFLAGDEAFFVCNVDIVLDLQLQPLVDRFLGSGWDAGLLVDPAGGETVFYDRGSHAYTGAAADTARSSSMVAGAFIGAALYRPSFLDELRRDDFSIVPVWKRMSGRGNRIGVIEVPRCFWRDIGTPGALAGIHFDCIDGTAPLAVDSRLSIDRAEGRCCLRRLKRRLKRTLGPHAWVETAAIGDDVRIVNSVVFPGARIEAGRTVENLIVTPDCEVAFGK